MNLMRMAIILSVIGAFLLTVAIIIPLVFPKIFESQIDKKLLIKPNSEMLEKFIDTPVPIYFQIWIFNLTNPEEVLSGAKPKLDQVGPYTYFQDRMKVDIKWNDDASTILFKQKKFYYFDANKSSGKESDIITTVNPVFMTFASKLNGDDVPPARKTIAQLLFLRFTSGPFMTHSVKETLFAGYDEPLLKVLYSLSGDPAHQKGKSGIFFGRNGTASGEIEVFTGKSGMSTYQHLNSWNDMKKLNFWKEDRCNRISGTDGAQFSRPITNSEPILLYTAELCRTIYADFEKDVQLGPLHLKRFVLPEKLLASTPENRCYCSSNFTCRSGMIDVSPCRKGSPIVISTPHFYQGSIIDQTNVEGLKPIKEEHETYLDVEPITGVSVRVAKRIQINMPLKKYADLPQLMSVPEVIMPILWVNESVEVPMENVKKLHRTLTLPMKVVTYGSWALLGVGIILILIALILTVKIYRNRSSNVKRQEAIDKKNAAANISLLDRKTKLNC